jgi:2-polyprenyl-3-methyl-5-hydroxy-6-metoxy-1,4-benzoquinol methylase
VWGTALFMSITDPTALAVEFPDDVARDQDHEWCRVTMNGTTRKIRFHDYHEIYSVPGLYEFLFYEHLECCSPQVVCGLLEDALAAEGVPAHTLRALDLGAGNGMVGEELAELGAEMITGVDLLHEAAAAAERDRPGVYDDYLVLDLTDVTDARRRELRERRFNTLVSVAALGFGDIPPRAFAEAFNLVSDGGWIAFNIKEHFLDDGEPTGFSRLIGSVLDSGIVEQRAEKVYRHRLSTSGDPLDYVALVGVKRSSIPDELVRAAERGL